MDDWHSAEVGVWAVYRTELRKSAKLRAFLRAVADDDAGARPFTSIPRRTGL